MRLKSAIAALFMAAATPALAQTSPTTLKISQFPNLAASAAAPSDAFPAQSNSCAGGNCRITVSQILGAMQNSLNAGLTAANFTTSGFNTDMAQVTGKLGGDASIGGRYVLNAAVSNIPASAGQRFSTDAVRGVAVIPPGSDTAFINAGVTGYVYNQSAMHNWTDPTHLEPLGPAVALNGIAACVVDHAWCWGLNTLVSDNNTVAASGGVDRRLYNELDLNITSPNTTGSALLIGGTWLANAQNVNALFIATPGGSAGGKYANAFQTGQGAASVGIALGASTTAAPGGSQPIVLTYWQNPGVLHTTSLYTTSDGSIIVSSNDAGNLDLLQGSLFLPSNRGILVNNNTVLAADSGANLFIGSGGSFSAVSFGNGQAGIHLNGPVSVATQTPSSSSSGCSTGQITFDYNYVYACPVNNHWRRSSLADF